MRNFIENILLSILFLAYIALGISCTLASNVKTGGVNNTPLKEESALHRPVQDSGYIFLSPLPFKLPASASLQCVSERVCWVISGGQAWKSSNGGQSWDLLSLPKSEDGSVVSAYFSDEKNGIAWNTKEYYLTLDSGKSWARGFQTPFESKAGRVETVSVFDGAVWLGGGHFRKLKKGEGVAGSYSNYSNDRNAVLEPALYQLLDKGKTWRKVHFPSDYGVIEALSFSQAKLIGAVCNGSLYYTKNGGGVWTRAKYPSTCVNKEYLSEYYEGAIVTRFTLDALNQWVAYDDGRVAKSSDGGKVWCDLLNAGELKFKAVSRAHFLNLHFVDSNNGWGLGGDSFLYMTKDGGKSWSIKESELVIVDVEYLKDSAILLTERGLYSFSLR